MDYNDQRRQDKSWNDPPMFSAEQINQAANTAPISKRYRYPQQAVNQRAYPNYSQGAANSYGNYSNNASMAPGHVVYGQQYPASYSSYGNANTASSQSSNNMNSNPYNPVSTTIAYPSQATAIQSVPTNNHSGYAQSSTTCMPSPYGESNLAFNLNSVPVSSMAQSPQVTAPAPGFNYNNNNPPQQQYPYRQY
ncbi:hypothetical protein BLA29_006784 [Euroglyphus maynei]|uniref:Uncharacterized protein n=1 Tax=Euroglyphus maynei TaxID=6958 RepID=A0A1Y3BSY1_EURMA|nr:hypothetical protein BLA29_006784 [Euroglyphus maynei]